MNVFFLYKKNTFRHILVRLTNVLQGLLEYDYVNM